MAFQLVIPSSPSNLKRIKSFAKTNGGSSSETVTLQARPMVPATLRSQFKVELYRSTISYPYQFNAILLHRWILWLPSLEWQRMWHTHLTTALLSDTCSLWVVRADHSADIRYQWDHRYIPGESKWWDWGWAIKEAGLSNMQYATGGSYVPSTLRIGWFLRRISIRWYNRNLAKLNRWMQVVYVLKAVLTAKPNNWTAW